MITQEAAFAFVTEIAWQGHMTSKGAAALGAKVGIAPEDVDQIIKIALEAGSLEEVPRIGGYVASKRINAQIFGEKYAEYASA